MGIPGLFGLFVLVLILTGLSAYIISRKLYNKLSKEQSKWAMALSNLTFILTWGIILFVLYWVFLSNVSLGR
jgi:uncharacterized BrkB/YihY/UPF0761 family membrane protein